MSKYSVIITAGGKGKRMKSSLPKQFISIWDKPILMYTIEKFYHFDSNFQIIVTLPEEWKEYWEALVAEHDFKIPHRVVSGGEERYHSIKNALTYCYGDFVLIHDGVRPLVNDKTLSNCVKSIRSKQAIIPVVPLADSLRKINGELTNSVDRTEYLIVQTPQCFKKEVLEKSYALDYHDGITDDASLVEEAGFNVESVDGNIENIKITTQADLRFAELFLGK